MNKEVGRGILRMFEEFLQSFLHTGNVLNGVRVVSGLTQFRLTDAYVDEDTGDLMLVVESPEIPKVKPGEMMPSVDIRYEKISGVWKDNR